MTDGRRTASRPAAGSAGAGKRGLPPRRAPIDPAAVAAPDRTAMLSVRMKEATLEALARAAGAAGKSQRTFIAEALKAKGVPVAAADLEDRPRARRRGGG